MDAFCSFSVAAKAVGKGRPRFAGGRVFTPKATVDFERMIGWHARIAMKGRRPTLNPCLVSVVITRKRPLKTKLAAPMGDTDNYVKSILDGMNKIVFVDDRQAIQISARKQWGAADMIYVLVKLIEQESQAA